MVLTPIANDPGWAREDWDVPFTELSTPFPGVGNDEISLVIRHTIEGQPPFEIWWFKFVRAEFPRGRGRGYYKAYFLSAEFQGFG